MPLAEKLRGFDRSDALPQRLATYLREEIVAGRLAPGERLVEATLSERCQVSRIPLREAFHLLSAEGLITLTPHRGATVTTLSDREMIDLFEARAAIEGHAARLAATANPRPHLAELRELVADMRRAIADGNIAHYYTLAGDFHQSLVEASDNAVLVRLFEQIRRQLRRYQAAMSRVPDLPRRSIAEHARILKAIEKRDATLAQSAATEHIASLVAQFKSRIGRRSRGSSAS